MRDLFEACEAMAKHLPVRIIPAERGTYLSRYLIHTKPNGGFVYLHFFHMSDAGEDLHCHPWPGRSLILAGGYREERREAMPDYDTRQYGVAVSTFLPGDVNDLDFHTYHRVDLIDPRGCWTMFETGPKSHSWSFWNRHTGKVTPWRDALAERGIVPTDPLVFQRVEG